MITLATLMAVFIAAQNPTPANCRKLTSEFWDVAATRLDDRGAYNNEDIKAIGNLQKICATKIKKSKKQVCLDKYNLCVVKADTWKDEVLCMDPFIECAGIKK